MDNRSWASGASASPPTAPYSPSVGYPTVGDPLTGTPATKGGAYWFHQMGEELRAILIAAGITPDKADLTQLLTALRSAGVFTTPAQFNNTTKVATTAFAMGIGLRSPVSGSGVSGTLPASVGGYQWLISSATPTTQTLPLANSVPSGTRIDFWNCHSGAATIARNGTDNIQYTQSYITSLILGTNDTLSLVSNGGSVWYMVGGSALLRYSTDFGSLLSANGYQKLPSGLIIQWGLATVTAGTVATITLPIAFPAACRSVIASLADGAATATKFANGAIISPSQIGLTVSAGTNSVCWFATGY